MNDNTPRQPNQRLVLHLDNGTELRFIGRLFAGGSWYDEESGVLTRQKLYATYILYRERSGARAQPPRLSGRPARRRLHHQRRVHPDDA